MKKLEAKELTLKYLMPYLELHSFDYKKSNSLELQILRNTTNGFDKFYAYFDEYNPKQQIVFRCSKTNNEINKIMLLLYEKINLNTNIKYDKKTAFVEFSYNSIYSIYDKGAYLPLMEIEADIKKSVDLIINFMDDIALPLFKKLQSNIEIDEIINGVNPWEDSWQKPYIFGNNFEFIRLIIKSLSNNSDYERLFEFVKLSLKAKFNEKYGQDFIDKYNQIIILDEILKTLPNQ